MADDNEDQGLLSLTTEIVASFVGNNPVAIGDLPAVIATVFGTLRSVTQGEAEKAAEAPVPAVPIKKSIGTDYLICLEDGHKVKTLKRYLASRYNLTPDQYRQRWGLAKTPPAYGSSRHRFAGRGLQGGGGWTRTLGRAWTRRSAPSTLAEAGPRPSADGGCRPGASRTPC